MIPQMVSIINRTDVLIHRSKGCEGQVDYNKPLSRSQNPPTDLHNLARAQGSASRSISRGGLAGASRLLSRAGGQHDTRT